MILELAELQMLSVAAASLALGAFLGAFATVIIKRPRRRPTEGRHRVRRHYSPSAKGSML